MFVSTLIQTLIWSWHKNDEKFKPIWYRVDTTCINFMCQLCINFDTELWQSWHEDDTSSYKVGYEYILSLYKVDTICLKMYELVSTWLKAVMKSKQRWSKFDTKLKLIWYNLYKLCVNFSLTLIQSCYEVDTKMIQKWN
jgi:hypothetical protein